eukprot:10734533-Ditylum_brightwellii.AAC.1
MAISEDSDVFVDAFVRFMVWLLNLDVPMVLALQVVRNEVGEIGINGTSRFFQESNAKAQFFV